MEQITVSKQDLLNIKQKLLVANATINSRELGGMNEVSRHILSTIDALNNLLRDEKGVSSKHGPGPQL